MDSVDLIVFDDAVARDWYPFTLTRPAGELILGTLKLRERLESVSRTKCSHYIANPDLAGFQEGNAPPVVDVAQIDTSRARLYLSSRCVLHWDVEIDLAAEATFHVADQVAGWLVPAGAAGPTEDELLAPSRTRGAGFNLGGNIIENVWDATVGMTAYAKGIKHQDDRVAFERSAGRLLASV